MPENNIAAMIRSVLEKNKGFMRVRGLVSFLDADIRGSLGIKKNETAKNIRRKIEQSTDNSFMFHAKGNATYIMIPCEPSEFVLGLLSEKRAFDTGTIKTLPFTKAEFYAVVNELVDEGKIKTKYDSEGRPKIYRVSEVVKSAQSVSVDDGEYTQEKFREAFDQSDKGRTFVRIFRMRRYLGWPREVFDDMALKLRKGGTIFLHQADPTILAKDEYDDSVIDEFGDVKGTMTWNE